MSWLDALGWCGSALLVLSLAQARVLRFRVLNLIACVILLAFNWALGIWPMVAMNAVLSGINLWFMIKLLAERHDALVYEVLLVKPEDAYLRHMLTQHANEIRSFQPDFEAPPETATVLLIQRGDETVGIVVLEVDKDVAEVRLDYVVRKYRDFSPGEFVWRKSNLLAELGIHRVRTSPTMVGAYYDKVGFRRDGNSFELEVG